MKKLGLTLAALFAANVASAAEYCPYRLVKFKSYDNKKVRYGLALGDDAIPSRVADITEPLILELGLFNDEAGERAAYVSKEVNQFLGKAMCNFQKNPEFTKQVTYNPKPEDILPAIPQPRNIVAMGLNAKAHAAELGKDGADGFIFAKNVALTGAYDPIVRPAYSLLDYEVELGVVIRKEIAPGTKITPENVKEYVAGLVLINDVSNRAPILLDKGDGKFTAAKSYETFAPVGPYYVPIENFQLESGRMLPKLKMYTGVVSAADARRGDLTNPSKRQEGSTDEADFYTNLSGAVALALEKRDLVDVGANLKPQKLLANGKFEAGDLLVMGTIAGVALQFKVSDGVQATREGFRYKKGDTLDVFWPHYKEMFTDGALKACADYDYGGPVPTKCMENWMRMKTWWVAYDYCKNNKYLAPGQIVVMGIEGLGMQMNAIIAAEDDATAAEEKMVSDPVAMDYLCGDFGYDYGKWALAAGMLVGSGAFPTYRIMSRINNRWTCPGGGLAQFGCRTGKVAIAVLLDMLIGTPVAALPAGNQLMSKRMPTLKQMQAKPEYQELAKLLGSSGKANELIYVIRGGAKIEEAVKKLIDDPALREETLRAIVKYKD